MDKIKVKIYKDFERIDAEIHQIDLNYLSDFIIDNDMIEEDGYDDYLNDIYDTVTMGYATFEPADIIKELSPGDYKIGFNEYIDLIAEDALYELERGIDTTIGIYTIELLEDDEA